MTDLASEPMRLQRGIQFGPFELDLETGELRKQGHLIKLAPKPSQALLLLAKSHGRLVTRDAMRRELWDSDTHVDFEHALNFCIREVRTALEDCAKKPRYIETLPRRGYRLIAVTRNCASRTPDSRPEAASNVASQQLEAYQYYESARKSFVQSGKEALEKARQDFKRALDIRPDYALAHSGLGAAFALSSLNRRHPEDLEAAQLHLTKALELDPELAEPYPWLCYVLMRTNRFGAAVQAGLRGVQLQPDLVTAHYFLGLAYFAGAEIDAAHFRSAATHLGNAARINRLWQPTWFVLSYVALLVGDYQHAEHYANTLLEMSRAPRGFPFIGAEIILGSVKLRQRNLRDARGVLLGFLESTAESDHMYRDAMSSTAACVLGDVELRDGQSMAALAAYRRGWHTVQEYPRIAAYQRITARAQAGLAAAYAATGERSRAMDLLGRASRTAQDSESIEHSAAGASMPELYWAVATAWARLRDGAQALKALQSAVRTGWRDAAWMEQDPELEMLKGSGAFQQLVEDVRRWPGVRFEEADVLSVLSE